jgi:hypothetical protein
MRRAFLPRRLVFDQGQAKLRVSCVGNFNWSRPYICDSFEEAECSQIDLTSKFVEVFLSPYAQAKPLDVILVFHMPRSGSTFLCEAIKRFSEYLVVSECTAINDVIIAYATDPNMVGGCDGAKVHLRQIFAFFDLEAKKLGKTGVVFKLTSWNWFWINLFPAHLFPRSVAMLVRPRDEIRAELENSPSSWLTLSQFEWSCLSKGLSSDLDSFLFSMELEFQQKTAQVQWLLRHEMLIGDVEVFLTSRLQVPVDKDRHAALANLVTENIKLR